MNGRRSASLFVVTRVALAVLVPATVGFAESSDVIAALEFVVEKRAVRDDSGQPYQGSSTINGDAVVWGDAVIWGNAVGWGNDDR